MAGPRVAPAAWLAIAFAVAGCAPAPPEPRRVAYLSTVGGEYDAQNLRLLHEHLAPRRSGLGPTRVERFELPGGDAAAALEPAVRAALGAGPFALVVASTSQTARVVQTVDPRTPLVFEASTDPVADCLVDSLRRPGRNATGYTTYLAPEPKMAEALLDAYPQLRRVVVLLDGRDRVLSCDNEPSGTPPASCRADWWTVDEAETLVEAKPLAAYLGARGIDLGFLGLCDAADLSRLGRHLGAHTGVVVAWHHLFYREARATVQALNRLRVPAVYPREFYVPMGGLMSVAPIGERDGEARAFELAVRVLKGEPPAALPVQRPEGFELAINLGTAASLEPRPSPGVLGRARRLVDGPP